MRNMRGRARWAALTSGVLLAAGLTPVIAGVESAGATETNFGYTCYADVNGETIAGDSGILFDLTVPGPVPPGSKAPIELTAYVNMISMPDLGVAGITGGFTVPLIVGDETTNVVLSDLSMPSDNLNYDGHGAAFLPAQAVAGKVPITLGTVTGSFRGNPGDVPVEITCLTTVEDEDLTIGHLDIVEGAPVPEPAALPVTGTVAITGTPKVGKTLTAVPGQSGGATITYQWFASNKPIAGATKSSLKLGKKFAGKKVGVQATYSKPDFLSAVQYSKSVKVKKIKKK